MRPDPQLEVDPFALLKAGLDHINQGISVFDQLDCGWSAGTADLSSCWSFPEGFVRPPHPV